MSIAFWIAWRTRISDRGRMGFGDSQPQRVDRLFQRHLPVARHVGRPVVVFQRRDAKNVIDLTRLERHPRGIVVSVAISSTSSKAPGVPVQSGSFSSTIGWPGSKLLDR
ncbi:MAG: hypothetical protein R3D84_15825 [Paracoccaceae bacterium]